MSTEQSDKNKRQRREDSLSSMSRSASKQRMDKVKDKNADLQAQNQQLLDELAALKKASKKPSARTRVEVDEDDDDDDDDGATTITTCTSRRSSKKRRGDKKQKGKQLTVDDFVLLRSKKAFRYVKFVSTEKQFIKFVATKVMNQMEDNKLHHKPGESDVEAAKVDLAREKFYMKHKATMTSGFNYERNYRQTRVKEACLGWMIANNRNDLFSNEDLETVMKRDLSAWEPKFDEEGNQTDPGDPDKLTYLQELQEFYVDKLIPACSGAHDFPDSIRHYVPLCLAKFSAESDQFPGKLIVPAGTEALILLFLKNARKKWEMMHDWVHVKGFTDKKMNPFPRWSKKEPEKFVEWKTLYSDTASGQSSFGGWKSAGLKEFCRLQEMMIKVRRNTTLCKEVDTAVKDRLFAKNQAYWNRANNRVPRPEPLEDAEEEIDIQEEEDNDYDSLSDNGDQDE